MNYNVSINTEPKKEETPKELMFCFMVVDFPPGSETNPQPMHMWLEVATTEKGAMMKANLAWENLRLRFSPKSQFTLTPILPLNLVADMLEGSSYPTNLKRLAEKNKFDWDTWRMLPQRNDTIFHYFAQKNT